MSRRISVAIIALLVTAVLLLAVWVVWGLVANKTPDQTTFVATDTITLAPTPGGESTDPASLNADALTQQLVALIDEKGDFLTWSLEDKAMWSQMQAQAGIVSEYVLHGLPGTEDIAQDEAIRLAVDALRQTYGLTDDQLAAYGTCLIFNVLDAQNPEWQVSFIADGDPSGELYTVTLHARTGQVIRTESGEDANG